MFAYLEIMRIWNSTIAVFGFFVAAALAGIPISGSMALLAAAVIFLQTSAGNALNDYFDYDIDKINRPYRPIPSGRIKLATSKYFGLVLFALSILIAFYLPASAFALAFFNAALSIAYSWKLKRTPAGHFIVSWLTASVFLFAALLASITLLVWIVFAMVFAISMVREIAKGLEDFKGDALVDAGTLAIVLGKPIAGLFAIGFGFLGIVLTILPYSFGNLKLGYIYLVAIADFLVLYAISLLQTKPGSAQRILKYTMLITLFALAAGLI